MTFAQRVVAAAAEAQAKGLSLHHVAVADADWPPSYPSIDLKSAPRASQSVLWAYDAKAHKLVPFPLGEPTR
jgi:hypothetical protein